jgi:hypothetical protein
MLPRDEKSFSNLRLKKMLEESTVRLNSWDEIVVARNLLVTLLANSGGPRSVSCYGGSNTSSAYDSCTTFPSTERGPGNVFRIRRDRTYHSNLNTTFADIA